MRTSTLLLLCVLGALAINIAGAATVKVIFYDNEDQDGDSASYPVEVTNACTKCEGFGFRLTNSWESYSIAGSGRYELHIYDDGSCSSGTKQATLSTPTGNFPGTLSDSVDSWILCPAGVDP